MSALKTILPHELVGEISAQELARAELISYFKKKGIGAFDDESVEEYKTSKVMHYNRIADVMKPIDEFLTTTYFLIGAGVVGVMLSGFFAFQDYGVSLISVFVALGGGVGGLAVALILGLSVAATWEHHHGSKWETVPFWRHDEEGRKIKPRVRELARMVEKERPDCAVFVERFAADPFLTVRLRRMPEVFLRVAVWGEQGYRIPKA